jgi:hypothetical protein
MPNQEEGPGIASIVCKIHQIANDPDVLVPQLGEDPVKRRFFLPAGVKRNKSGLIG